MSGPRVIQVTRRQVEAAQAVVQLDELLGRETDPAVLLIAQARPR